METVQIRWSSCNPAKPTLQFSFGLKELLILPAFFLTYRKGERIETICFEVTVAGDLKDSVFVLQRLPQDADKRLPHVTVERVADEGNSFPSQHLQHPLPIQPAPRFRYRYRKKKKKRRKRASKQSLCL